MRSYTQHKCKTKLSTVHRLCYKWYFIQYSVTFCCSGEYFAVIFSVLPRVLPAWVGLGSAPSSAFGDLLLFVSCRHYLEHKFYYQFSCEPGRKAKWCTAFGCLRKSVYVLYPHTITNLLPVWGLTAATYLLFIPLSHSVLAFLGITKTHTGCSWLAKLQQLKTGPLADSLCYRKLPVVIPEPVTVANYGFFLIPIALHWCVSLIWSALEINLHW